MEAKKMKKLLLITAALVAIAVPAFANSISRHEKGTPYPYPTITITKPDGTKQVPSIVLDGKTIPTFTCAPGQYHDDEEGIYCALNGQ
jgi:hypothetical protein